MKNSNRKFFRDQWNIFENLSQQQVIQLCFSDITFTTMAGFLYLRKENITDHKYRIPAKNIFAEHATIIIAFSKLIIPHQNH